MFNKLIHFMLFCFVPLRLVLSQQRLSSIFTTPYPKQSPLHLTLYPNRSIIYVFGIPTNDAKLVMGLENTLTIFLQAKIHGITSATVNLEEMLDNTLL